MWGSKTVMVRKEGLLLWKEARSLCHVACCPYSSSIEGSVHHAR